MSRPTLNAPETADAVVDRETGWCVEPMPTGTDWILHCLIPHRADCATYPTRAEALAELAKIGAAARARA